MKNMFFFISLSMNISEFNRILQNQQNKTTEIHSFNVFYSQQTEIIVF